MQARQLISHLFLCCVAIASFPPSLSDCCARSPDESQVRKPKIEVPRNLHYRDHQSRASACDVYLHVIDPAEDPQKTLRPAVVIVHGGGWLSGDKWTTTTYAEEFADRGYVVMNINYRLAPTHRFPKQVDDVRQALLWLKSHAKEFRIDMRRLGMAGYSAGGHLIALVSLPADETIESRVATSSWKADDVRWKQMPKIAAVCIGGPPCDFRSIPEDSRMLAYFLGGSRKELPDVYRLASPVVHVSPKDPPMRIIHGETDMLVPIVNSKALNRAMKTAGVSCDLKVIAGHGHMMTFLAAESQKHTFDFFERMFAMKPGIESEVRPESGNGKESSIKTADK